MKARAILVQVPAYVAFAAFIGYFSSAPPYRHLAPGRAVVKVSLAHAGERKQPCRERSAEELAKLAPNMRAATDCPRERSDVAVALEMDGATVYRAVERAPGLRHDLPATLYHRMEVPAGLHVFRARMADTAAGDFRHDAEAIVNLPPGRVLVVDFDGGANAFVFRH